MTNYPITPAQTSGPLFGFSLLHDALLSSVQEDDPSAIIIEGAVTDVADAPLQFEAFVELWAGEQFVRARAGRHGVFRVTMRKPGPVSLPDGRALAPHINVRVFGRGLNKHITSRLYFPDEPNANAGDPVLALVEPGRRDLLIARPGNEPNSLRFDVSLQGPRELPIFRF